jgi:UDP-N-acetylmuramate dehydrogenase
VQSLGLNIQENVLLSPYTTLRIGGPARFFACIPRREDLAEAVTFARQRDLPVFVLGGGSNLLVTDAGFPGLVIQPGWSPTIVPRIRDGEIVAVSATTDWNDFVLGICEQGISGVECLAGIPGLVGGAPIQNIGAYGQEVSKVIRLVDAFDTETMTFVVLRPADCCFGYRSSIFNTTCRNRYIVTSVSFGFDAHATPNLSYPDLAKYFAECAGDGEAPTPLDVYHAVREIRHRKGMLLVEGERDCRSAGSFFKNPVISTSALERIAASLEIDPAVIPNWPAGEGLTKVAAAWLLENAGFHKGFALGEAGISSRHTLALINRGRATAGDIIALRDRIQETVNVRFGIQLEQEPVQLGGSSL